jgi:hypothetical protein
MMVVPAFIDLDGEVAEATTSSLGDARYASPRWFKRSGYLLLDRRRQAALDDFQIATRELSLPLERFLRGALSPVRLVIYGGQ